MKILSMAILSLCLVLPSARAGELTLASEEWPPYSFSRDGEMTGFCVELVRAVLDRMKTTARIHAYPWVRAEQMALTGQVDGLFSASRKDRREQVCHYPDEPLFDSEYVFFVRKEGRDSARFSGFAELKGKRVGVTRAYSYSEALWDFLRAEGNFVEAASDERNFRVLVGGRIDFFPAERANGLFLLKEMGISDRVIPLEGTIVEKPYFLIFNKERVSGAVADRFGAELRAFKETPAFDALRDRWLR